MFSSRFVPSSLPIIEAFPKIFSLLEDEGRNIVLIAPPGAGKTSSIPLILLEKEPAWLKEGKILLIEPRRVAVRGAALRMAHLYGEKIGQKIGYSTRLERYISDDTRIEVLTEGLFIRRILQDPFLNGVGAVIFDEVHERSLECDNALALALDMQENLRRDMRLILMSATLDASLFVEKCRGEVIETKGRAYPIEIRHQHDIGHFQELPERCAQAIFSLWQEAEGSILAFLPGVGEIKRTEQALLKYEALIKRGEKKLPIFPLYGELSLEEQNKALSEEEGRRIILATPIAETSLTVAGVRNVVDCGWRRKPRRDPSTAIPKLENFRISRATAEQRAGRAGREAPGITVRLWSEMTQRALLPQEVPEIKEADLSSLSLIGAAWEAAMGTKIEDLPFLEAPPQGALAAGRSLVQSLGGLDEAHKITKLGEKMIRCGTHPRLAALLCAAQNIQELITASYLIALLEDRDPIRQYWGRDTPSVDIVHRLELFSYGKNAPYFHRSLRPILRMLKESAERFLQRAAPFMLSNEEERENLKIMSRAPLMEKPGRLLAAAFPDRIAQLTNEGRYRLSGGGSARLSVKDHLAKEKLLVAVGFHHHKGMEITLAAPLDLEDFPPSLTSFLEEQNEPSFDGVAGRVMKRQRLRLGALILKDRLMPAEAEEALPLLLEKILSDLPRYLTFSEEVKQFQARIALLRAYGEGELADISFESLSQSDGSWLAPYMQNYVSLEPLKELPLLKILKNFFSYEQLSLLEKYLPSGVSLARGKRMIDYTAPVPSLSAKAQEFYGISSLPLLMEGRLELRAILLSPAGRPQAVTSDLAGFWKNSWQEMRREMRGRYPKHDWPEDPSLHKISLEEKAAQKKK